MFLTILNIIILLVAKDEIKTLKKFYKDLASKF